VRSGGCSDLSSHTDLGRPLPAPETKPQSYASLHSAGVRSHCRIEVGTKVEAAVKCPDMSRGARLTAHSAVSTSLALCSDRALRELVDTAVPIGSGIGGKSVLLEVAGTPVFVKRVPLTDPERQPEYGIGTIGGPGFGAWRELAVHTMTTNWVLAAEHEGFPLMYHWRVLPDSTPLPEELADIERAVAYWAADRRCAAGSRLSSSPRRASRCSWSTSRRTCTGGWAPRSKQETKPPTKPAPWRRGN